MEQEGYIPAEIGGSFFQPPDAVMPSEVSQPFTTAQEAWSKKEQMSEVHHQGVEVGPAQFLAVERPATIPAIQPEHDSLETVSVPITFKDKLIQKFSELSAALERLQSVLSRPKNATIMAGAAFAGIIAPAPYILAGAGLFFVGYSIQRWWTWKNSKIRPGATEYVLIQYERANKGKDDAHPDRYENVAYPYHHRHSFMQIFFRPMAQLFEKGELPNRKLLKKASGFMADAARRQEIEPVGLREVKGIFVPVNHAERDSLYHFICEIELTACHPRLVKEAVKNQRSDQIPLGRIMGANNPHDLRLVGEQIVSGVISDQILYLVEGKWDDATQKNWTIDQRTKLAHSLRGSLNNLLKDATFPVQVSYLHVPWVMEIPNSVTTQNYQQKLGGMSELFFRTYAFPFKNKE